MRSVYLDKEGRLCCSNHKEPLCWYMEYKNEKTRELAYKVTQCIECRDEEAKRKKKIKR